MTVGFAVQAMMVCTSVALVLGSWFVPPEYSAVMLRDGGRSDEVVTCAAHVLPPASAQATGLPIATPLSLNWIVPSSVWPVPSVGVSGADWDTDSPGLVLFSFSP